MAKQYKTYSEKLKSPLWQRKRLKVLERDEFTCKLCNDKNETLHVHHLSYENKKDPWDVKDENLITYCKVCHELVESIKEAPELKVIGCIKDNYNCCWGVVSKGSEIMAILNDEDLNIKTTLNIDQLNRIMGFFNI